MNRLPFIDLNMDAPFLGLFFKDPEYNGLKILDTSVIFVAKCKKIQSVIQKSTLCICWI